MIHWALVISVASELPLAAPVILFSSQPGISFPPLFHPSPHLSSANAKLLFLLIKIFYRQILSSLNFIFHKTWQLDFWVPGLRPSKTNVQKIRSVQKAWVQPYAYANELDDCFSMCVLTSVHVCVCVHVCVFVYISACIWVWPLNQEVTFPLGLSAQGRSFSSLGALALRLMSSCSPATILKSSLLPSHFHHANPRNGLFQSWKSQGLLKAGWCFQWI